MIRRLTEGKTAIIIEHDMDVVFSLADRITVLHYGAILRPGHRPRYGRTRMSRMPTWEIWRRKDAAGNS